jgi:hypothetical protein
MLFTSFQQKAPLAMPWVLVVGMEGRDCLAPTYNPSHLNLYQPFSHVLKSESCFSKMGRCGIIKE